MLINEACVNMITVMIMKVPCCASLILMSQEAAISIKRKAPISVIVISLQGEILRHKRI